VNVNLKKEFGCSIKDKELERGQGQQPEKPQKTAARCEVLRLQSGI
jgi:hypothetical protein